MRLRAPAGLSPAEEMRTEVRMRRSWLALLVGLSTFVACSIGGPLMGVGVRWSLGAGLVLGVLDTVLMYAVLSRR